MRALRVKMRLFPSVNERETTSAPGNFFRITFSNLAIFLNLSVATTAILNRARLFLRLWRLTPHQRTLIALVDGELQHEDRYVRR